MKVKEVGLILLGISGAFVLGSLTSVFFFRSESSLVDSVGVASCFLTANSAERVLGRIDDKPVVGSSLPPDLQSSFLELEMEHYRKVRDVFNQALIRYELSSRRDGVSAIGESPPLSELVPQPVTDEDVREFFFVNRKNFANTTYEQVESTLRRHLQQQKESALANETLASLQQAGRVLHTIPIPCGLPSPHKPPADSFVLGSGALDFMVIGDYQCAPCRYLSGTLDRLLQDHPGRIRLVSVLSPSRVGGEGDFLVRGAYCAREQGDAAKLAAYHAAASFTPVRYASSGAIEEPSDPRASARGVARQVGLNEEVFSGCLESSAASEFVASQRQYVESLNGASAPSFFLNGRRLLIPPQLNLSDLVEQVLRQIPEDPQ